MKKNAFLTVWFLLAAVYAYAGPAIRVFDLDSDALSFNKNRILAKDPAVMAAYKLLIKDANEALQFGPVSVMEKKDVPPSGDKHDYMSLAPYFWPDPSRPNGLPYMRKDGETNPEVKDYKDKEYMPRLCQVVHLLALAWYFSGDQQYADHAAKLTRVWFLDPATRMNPNLNFGQAIKGVNTGRGAGMIDSRHFIKLIDGVGLLAGNKSWTKTDQEGLQYWFRQFLQWMQTSKVGTDEMKAANNHGAWYDAQRLSIALFLDSSNLAKKIIANAETRLDKQMAGDGSFPLEMERTTSLHYTGFVMQAFFNIATMATTTGIDFWNYTSPSGKSLQKGFKALQPYLAQQQKWTGQQIKDYEFEEAIPLLMDAAAKLNCRECLATVKNIMGEKFDRLLLRLLYK